MFVLRLIKFHALACIVCINTNFYQKLSFMAFNHVCGMYNECQKSCTPCTFDFFKIKFDDFKNQFSLVFMPVQKTIVAEKIKCIGNHAYILEKKCKIVTFGYLIFLENVFIQTIIYMLSV